MRCEIRTFVFFAAAVQLALLVVGCMGPDVQFVPETIEIYGAELSDITSTTAVVTWNTTHATYGRVQIVRQEDFTNTVTDFTNSTRHRVALQGLEPGKYYMLIVQSTNGLGAGAFETGKELILRTLDE